MLVGLIIEVEDYNNNLFKKGRIKKKKMSTLSRVWTRTRYLSRPKRVSSATRQCGAINVQRYYSYK